MKTSACYRRVCEDPAFRREKLDELRFLKGVQAALSWVCLLFATAFSFITGIGENLPLFGAAMLSAGAYSYISNRFAALEALENNSSQAPEPSFENGFQG